MNIIEFFSGTESFSKVARSRGHNCFTIDIEPRFNPDLCKDILLLKKDDLPFIPDVIWASPPCTQYSKAKTRGVRDIKKANAIVAKTIKLIDELNPKFWFIENPQTGLLKNQPVLNNIFYHRPYKDISYCKYGLPYKKQTRIWTNLNSWHPKPVCRNDCAFITKGLKRTRHIGSAGCGSKGQGHKIAYSNKRYSREEKYKIPEELCLEIMLCLEKELKL